MQQGLNIELDQLVPIETFDEAAVVIANEQGEAEGKRMKRALSVMAGSKLYAAMSEKFRQIDLLSLFAKGWGESPAIKSEADRLNEASEPKFIRLGKFEQLIELYPILTVSIAGLSGQPIRLALNLEAEFEALEIGLTKGYIIEAGGGMGKLSAVLRFGQFSFPAGIGPVEFQMKDSRRFEQPGIAITGRTGVGDQSG